MSDVGIAPCFAASPKPVPFLAIFSVCRDIGEANGYGQPIESPVKGSSRSSV